MIEERDAMIKDHNEVGPRRYAFSTGFGIGDEFGVPASVAALRKHWRAARLAGIN
jgi:hypothetical protein